MMVAWCWLLVLFISPSLVVSAAEGIASFSYSELSSPTPSDDTKARLLSAVTEVGALRVNDIPGFGEARRAALSPLALCLTTEEEKEGVTSMLMTDGTPRRTIHAATTRGVASAFSSKCGASADNLRSAIDDGMRQLLAALDYVRTSSSSSSSAASAAATTTTTVNVMRPSYSTYQDIARHGEHLEHLHSYYASAASSSSTTSSSAASGAANKRAPTINFHTDGGLFIAMTAGLYMGAEEPASAGLFLQTRDGGMLRIGSDEAADSLVFMVGEAGAKWLAPVLGKPLQAVPHKLVASFSVGQADASRSWYGKMYLPPSDALVPVTTAAASASAGSPFGSVEPMTTYARYRAEVNRALTSSSSSSSSSSFPLQQAASLPAACGPNAQLMSSSTCTASDGSAGVECWMQCMSTSSMWCGQEAVCYDSATNSVNDGNDMCESTCSLICPYYIDAFSSNATSANSGDSNDYCYGQGTSMAMSGFVSQAFAGKTAPCMLLLFGSWALDGPAKFGMACIGTFLLGILLQFVTKTRIAVTRWKLSPHMKTATICALYSANTTIAYLLMLIAMTYSTELFIMVLLGLSTGYALFLVNNYTPINTDPCCGDESEKREGVTGTLNTMLISPASHSLIVNSD